jgi:hypothetical protein
MRRTANSFYAGRHAAAAATAGRASCARSPVTRFLPGIHKPSIERAAGRDGGAASRWEGPAKWACKRRVSRVSAMCQRYEEGIGP